MKTLAVVYQFGKVASTSLVATLNEIENVEATQSHFLGRAALTSIFQTLTRPETSDYFFEHQLGQLIHNTGLTRRLDKISSGEADERLLVMSLTRDPLAWFRSSIVQDIKGYLPQFQKFLTRLDIPYENESELVKLALTRSMSIFETLLSRNGGVDAAISALASDPVQTFANTAIESDPDMKRVFYMMLRPFTWFSDHFERSLGVRVGDMTPSDGILSYSNGYGDYFIFKYENLETAFPLCLNRLGFQQVPALKAKNVSVDKYLAKEIESAFSSPAAQRLNRQFQQSEYARRFGYT